MNVLVFEPNKAQASLISAILQKNDVNHEVAQTSTRAVEISEQTDFDVIFFDIDYEGDFIDVINALRVHNPMATVAALSTITNSSSQHLEGIVEVILFKPFFESTLCEFLGIPAEDNYDMQSDQIFNFDQLESVSSTTCQTIFDELQKETISKTQKIRTLLQFNEVEPALTQTIELKNLCMSVGAERLGRTLQQLEWDLIEQKPQVYQFESLKCVIAEQHALVRQLNQGVCH